MASQNTINQRVGHRGFVTKIINSVSGFLEEGKVQRLESAKRTLEEEMSLLQRLDGEILEGLKEEQEMCNEIKRSSDIRLNIQETIFQIDSKLKEISISEEHSVNTNVNSNVNGFLENSFESRNNSNGKLPNLSIKCSNGNPIEFQSFFDQFRAAIHENDSLKSIKKFNYLRAFLRGPALASISGLSLTSENYNQAIEILEK